MVYEKMKLRKFKRKFKSYIKLIIIGVARVGGILHDHRGKNIEHYSWGLGEVLNNQAGAYSLWCRIIIDRKLGIREFLAFGNSIIIIKEIINLFIPRGIKIRGIVSRIRQFLSHIDKVELFHI
jgi:hypothetical protein